ncbi:inovirus-type Gp2 protein [Caballeronia zhejiangensis]|uniref:Inovirus Gp2 family protein n=1 Tax=Caballeronia zhejiangensis TaxID=871203 RepID=A0A656QIN8_9BURK|nr:inovirus-type Gp2 protein [Caballeronia zhejiangensis]EKS69120.1 hypothetical protein BURK_028880 [Burkholderia sp. SJ98]KDR29289.1 hypothetical protein BG60_08175 [Caballeronia zhejiangensis]
MKIRYNERQKKKVLELEEGMFEWRSRHLIISVTFNYKPEYRHRMTFDDVCHHRDKFISNMKMNGLLGKINGYAWKIEEGDISGGLHIHWIFFYDGKYRQDVLIARSLIDYWSERITRGMGDGWNSNHRKERYEERGHGIGVGQIDRNDMVRRDALRKNLEYLTKACSYPATRTNRYRHMFGASQLPRPR